MSFANKKIFLTFIIVLPDYVPIPHNSTWSKDLEKDFFHKPRERFINSASNKSLGLNTSNITSLKFWQAIDDLAGPSTFERNTTYAGRVLEALTGKERKNAHDDSSKIFPKTEVTIVEAVIGITQADSVLESGVVRALDTCLEFLFEVHEAYRLRYQLFIPRLTYQRLHPIVFWTTRLMSSRTARHLKHEPKGILFLDNLDATLPSIPTMSEPTDDLISQHYSRKKWGDTFLLYSSNLLEARQEMVKHGDTSKALLSIAIAAEVLLNGVLSLAIWEEDQAGSINEASKAFSLDFTQRLKNDYAKRFGGNWSIKSGVLLMWFENIATPRNRIVHAGYRPTQLEADKALEAIFVLESFVGERLSANWKKYPRTAWLFLGHEGFERRGLTQKPQNWLKEQGGTQIMQEWLTRHRTWRDLVDQRIQRRRSK